MVPREVSVERPPWFDTSIRRGRARRPAAHRPASRSFDEELTLPEFADAINDAQSWLVLRETPVMLMRRTWGVRGRP